MNNEQNLKRHEDVTLRTVTPEIVTDGQVAADTKEAEALMSPNLYTGNIAYIKTAVNGSPDKAYVLVYVRFCNDKEQVEQAVQVYPSTKNGFRFEVGDMIAFEAKRIRSAIDAKTEKQMYMGTTPLFKASGVMPDLELRLVRRAGAAVAGEIKGEIKSEGLRAKLASLSPFVARLLGL